MFLKVLKAAFTWSKQ